MSANALRDALRKDLRGDSQLFQRKRDRLRHRVCDAETAAKILKHVAR